MFTRRFISRVTRVLFCLGLLATTTAQASSDRNTRPKTIGAPTALDEAAVLSFVQTGLTMIAKRDERIFSMVTDGSRILTPEFTRAVLGYRTKVHGRDARKWRRLFPGYSRVPLRHIKYIKIIERNGPLRADVKVVTGGTEKNLKWKTVAARFVLLKIKLPRRSRALTCKVYMVDGRLYWEPFGW